MAYKSDAFGRLFSGAVKAIASFEGRNVDVVDEELGNLIGRNQFLIQRYKTGHVPDDPHIVRKLTEAGVKRGQLARSWAEKFLHAARYYDSSALLQQLFPDTPMSVPPHHVVHNLPAPTYSQFVMRRVPFAQVLDGLRQRTAVVAIISMGGMGKTSLALEVAVQCCAVQPRSAATLDNLPEFQAAVWVSDKRHPGSVTLPTVLDEIAYTLNYPGYTQFELPRKRREIDQLLKRQPILLVVDNFETITDAALAEWLLQLPAPSKAMITSREHHPAFEHTAWLVELGGMDEDEARAFIDVRTKQIGAKQTASRDLQQQVFIHTGGNPKAIELLLGLSKRTGRTITTFADDSSVQTEALLMDLFGANWMALPEASHTLLHALTMFANSVARDALARVAGVDQTLFDQALPPLLESALVDMEHTGDRQTYLHGRYTLHPLVRQFVARQQREQRTDLTPARERWLKWAVQYVDQFGYLLKQVGKLEQIDADEPTLAATVPWALEHGHLRETIQLVHGLEFYYYVRGWWDKKLKLHEQYLAAAQQLGDRQEQIRALTMHIQLLSRTDAFERAAPYLHDLHTLTATHPMTGELLFHVWHAEGLYHLATEQYATAERAWQHILTHAAAQHLPDHMVMGAQRWLGLCLYRQGRIGEAQVLLTTALTYARAHHYWRDIARCQLHLAQLALDAGDIADAQQRLAESQMYTEQTDVEQQAHVAATQGRLFQQQGNPQLAREAINTASERFARMGLMRAADQLHREASTSRSV